MERESCHAKDWRNHGCGRTSIFALENAITINLLGANDEPTNSTAPEAYGVRRHDDALAALFENP
jgi:hypothetical protein